MLRQLRTVRYRNGIYIEINDLSTVLMEEGAKFKFDAAAAAYTRHFLAIYQLTTIGIVKKERSKLKYNATVAAIIR
jgi:hypothetical protein